MITPSALFVFILGLIVGYVLNMMIEKWIRKTHSSDGVKKEFEAYRSQVESHFEATSEKFQSMSNQYQDLYQHLAQGATSLCRADKVTAPMVEQSDILGVKPQLETKEPEQSAAETKKEAIKTKEDKNSPQAKINLGAKKTEADKNPPSGKAPEVKK